MPRLECGFTDTAQISGPDFLGQVGPTVLIEIGYDAVYQPAQVWNPTQREVRVPALIDTGATQSSIDETIAQRLNLPLIDRVSMGTPDGRREFNVYVAQIRIPELDFVQYGSFAGIHLQAGNQLHQALLGRTLLRSMTLYYDGQRGIVTLYK
jgi:predicted aspartyl protease